MDRYPCPVSGCLWSKASGGLFDDFVAHLRCTHHLDIHEGKGPLGDPHFFYCNDCPRLHPGNHLHNPGKQLHDPQGVLKHVMEAHTIHRETTRVLYCCSCGWGNGGRLFGDFLDHVEGKHHVSVQKVWGNRDSHFCYCHGHAPKQNLRDETAVLEHLEEAHTITGARWASVNNTRASLSLRGG